jgi:hypothetical protein
MKVGKKRLHMSRNTGFSRRAARNPIVPRAAIGATHWQVIAKVEW